MWTDDGSFRFWSRDEEIHVSADVAYGVLSYVAATGDEDFLHEYGLEILVETSRFWVDRATPGEGERLSILQVMGPDEFHSHVDDNAFTNVMAAWCLRAAADACDRAARLGGGIVARLADATAFTADEPAQWREVADRLRVPGPGPGVIEQFSGYFQRRDVPITDWDDNDMPRYPDGYHHFNCESTMLVKQPDVLMLFHLLPDAFDHATKLANFEFYEARTLHKSSLSPAIHAVLGLEVGDARRAMQYFCRSAMVDLDDNQGNTVMGMHIASAAGTWQILVNGFAGFRVLDGTMAFDPRLPPEWDEVRFRLHWRGARLTVTVGHAELGLALDGDDDGSPVPVVVRGHELVLVPGAQVVQPLETGTRPR
jgi:kojibiose phosphorylase